MILKLKTHRPCKTQHCVSTGPGNVNKPGATRDQCDRLMELYGIFIGGYII